jgi:uncharacterized protein YfaS (alpha-2-macroglobulin family)
MDLLRLLLLSPLRAIRWGWRLLGRVLALLVGHVSWSAPGWASFAARTARRRPWHVLAAAALVLLVGGGGYWYAHRPKPVEPDQVTWKVHAPETTHYYIDDKGPQADIHPLEVTFSGSAAPIELVNKTVTRGIAMSPAIKGEWRWSDDKTLRFTPAADWPVGAHVQVRFDARQAFAPQVKMADDRFAFDLTPFSAQLGNRDSNDNNNDGHGDGGQFYQDPQDPKTKQALFQIVFNYPVDPATLESRLKLSLVGRDGKDTPLRYTVTYDKLKLNAWVRSQPLEIPRDPLSARLDVDKGVRGARGGDGGKDALTASVRVPGLYSLVVNDMSPTLVDNDRYEPEQVLVAKLSDGVRGGELATRAKAWVLPKRKPDAKADDDDDPPYAWAPGQVSEAVLKQSTPLPLEVTPTESEFAPLQSFKYHAPPGARVYVRVDAGLQSAGGYQMGAPGTGVFTVPDYPKLLRFMSDGALLSLSGDKRISVVGRNLPGMMVEVGRVLPDQLQHLVSLSSGAYAKPSLPWNFSADHITERFEIKRAFPAADPGKARYDGIDLSEYLKPGKRGVFLLRLSPYDPAKEKKQKSADADGDNSQGASADADGADESGADGDTGDGDDSDSNDSGDSNAHLGDTRLIVVTDLGMLVKRALDGSQDVFIESIRTGKPVGGATVSVLAINGQPLFTQTTSAEGVVHFPPLKGLEREKQPALYTVSKDSDLSFLPIKGDGDRRLDFSRFDVAGERNAKSAGELSAYLFSDRGIYRPGDLFHVGMIVRAADWARSPAGVPLQAEIVDPRGVTVKRQSVAVDAAGFTALDYTPPETAPTGAWTVNLYIDNSKDKDKDNQLIGSATVQVKEFLPDRMKVTAKLSRQVAEGWVKPDDLKAQVDAQNLFGTPAQNRRVTATLTLRPAWPAFQSWPGYNFFATHRPSDGYNTDLQDGATDAQGHAQFDLDLKRYADATYQLTFLARAFEADGGRGVTASARTLVSNQDWLVGYKSADDLGYVKRGAARGIKLIAINPQAKAMALDGLRAQRIEKRYVSVLTQQDSGVYKYESRLKEIPLEDKPLSIPAAGLDLALATDKPGNYALVIRRADGAEVNRVEYSVAGQANVSRSLDRNAELQITLDKRDYNPGEQVEIAIRAPYAGSGLITIERDKVYAHAWFHADTTSSIQHITVPAGFEGSGYINVQYVRDPASDEIFMSPLSYGVAPFSVNLDARRAALTVDAPALVKPGETATFTVHSAKPTKVVVFAVDEGILQVARYKLGDPLKFFFRKRMLQVDTAQILDLILPDFGKLMAMAAPGGDDDDAIGRQLNPFKRKRDQPVAYWSGIIDVNGEQRLSYPVPDYFNGKLRVMAVAVAPERVGTFEGATTVRGDFVLSPNAPTTLAPGDEADVSVGVANNLPGADGKPMPVEVTLKTGPQLQVLGAAAQNIPLAPGREGVARFRVKATDTLGSGALAFDARPSGQTTHPGGKAAHQVVDVSVRPAAPFRTRIDFARLAPGKTARLPQLRQMYGAYAARDASISTAPLVFGQGLAAYLTNFEHYCTEQLLSAMAPRFFAAKWLSARVLTKPTERQFAPEGATGADKTAAFFDLLRSRQNAQGGFGLWSARQDADPFVSTYAMHVLLDARERGAAVPPDMFDAGNAYLRKLAAGDSDAAGGMVRDAETLDVSDRALALLRQRAYAVYLLTRQGNVTTNDLAAVQKRLQEAYPKVWKDDLAAAWLAASYQLLKQDKPAAELIAGPQKLLERSAAREQPYRWNFFMDPLTRDSTVLYLLARHFPDRAAKLSPRAIENIASPVQQGLFNTLSSAMTIMALDAYASTTAGGLDKLAIQATRAGANGGANSGKAQDISTLQANLMRVASWPADATRVDFVNDSSASAWWIASQSGYDRGASAQAIKNGLEIVREYTDADGKPVSQVKVGQEIQVHLKIRATDRDNVDDVAIVDLLPGGFDPVAPPPPADEAKSGADSGHGGNDGDSGNDGSGGDDAASAAPRSPVAVVAGSTWTPDYADVREDRVVIYGLASTEVREFVYRIKATNTGRFGVPPAYGESMYDRRIQAQSPGGATLTVVPAQ